MPGFLAPILASAGGSILSSLLNKPKNARTPEQSRVESAQAQNLEQQTRIRSELESMIGGLADNPRPPRFNLGVGEEPFDFNTLAPMGEINLLMQLAGMGTPTNAVTQGNTLQSQSDQAGADSTGATVQNLVEMLLRGGLGGGGGGGIPASPGAGQAADLSNMLFPTGGTPLFGR